MSEASEGKLFEGPSEQDAAHGPLLFVTNRYNLLEFLSAGYVLPVNGIPKYYADLLQLCPGRLPLVRGAVTASVAEAVSKEDPTAFPVALSVDSQFAASVTAPSLSTDGTVSSGPLDGAAVAFAPAGLLPLAGVSRVHFRSQAELDEHEAREYENVRSGEVELVVSADLFEGPGVEVEQLRQFLNGLPPVDEATAEFFDDMDRLNGARSMLAAMCPPTLETMRTLGELLAGKAPEGKTVPSWLGALFAPDRPKPSAADERLYLAAADVFRHEDRAAEWRPLEVLVRVEERLSDQKMSKKDEAEIAKNLRPIGAILRNERDFKPFGADSGLAAAKALLLVLLRPDPERLASWERAETGADDQVMLAAGGLVGLLKGHKKLSLKMRSPALDRLLANRTAVAAAQILPDALRPPASGRSLTVNEEASADGGAVVRLEWGDDVVIEKERRPPSLIDRLLAEDLTSSVARDLALDICRTQAWSDCVSTTILVPSDDFVLDAKAKAVRITAPGFLDVTYELQEAQFRSRLVSEGLTAELEAEVQSRLDR